MADGPFALLIPLFPSKTPARCLWLAAFLLCGISARAQFKEVGPAPYPPAVARQKVRTLLEKADPGNPQPTVDALFALVPWYRDILDQELIAGWRQESRGNLAPLIAPLADAAVAAAIVEYSWRQAPQTAFTPAYAPMLGQLMARYPDSSRPFLADLLGPPPALSNSVTEAACRILLDMPDLGTWHKDALHILPHYRQVTERLLAQDLQSGDRERGYRAQIWRSELQGDEPGVANQPSQRRRLAVNPPSVSRPAVSDRMPAAAQSQPPAPAGPRIDSEGRPTLARAESSPPPSMDAGTPSPAPAPPPSLFAGAKSGTLKCSGPPTPQNAEYVFRNLPRGNMQLDYDTKNWEARLVPEGQTQKLILTNRSSGPRKRCTVRWSVSP